jgi:hypothetical protein
LPTSFALFTREIQLLSNAYEISKFIKNMTKFLGYAMYNRMGNSTNIHALVLEVLQRSTFMEKCPASKRSSFLWGGFRNFPPEDLHGISVDAAGHIIEAYRKAWWPPKCQRQ